MTPFLLYFTPVLIFVAGYFIFKKRNGRTIPRGQDEDTGERSDSGPSASSTSVLGNNYYLFLSFRGADTRKGFVDHLYHKLVDVGLHNSDFVFRDDEKLRIGQPIADNLLDAIKRSKISIPVISEDYAGSKWCLIELIEIMESHERRGQIVLPVLYKVKIDDVKNMEGKFGDAFRREKHRFDEEFEKKAKAALQKAVKLKVYKSEEDYSGYEGKLVKELIQAIVLRQQHDFPPSFPKDLVGIDDHVARVMNLADTASPETRIIVIYGISGIGKTTLATFIYKELFDKFNCLCLNDIRETIKSKGMEHVQSLLASHITKSRVHDSGIEMIRRCCEKKKVLILLDDVDSRVHLDNLIGGCDFESGSRIIITCRDKALLKPEYKGYELKEMNREDSLLLFRKYAFEGEQPPTELVALSSEIVVTTGRIPLALVIIGSFLKRKDKSIWTETLEKLKKVPHMDVQQKLRISYDSLGYEEQQMFLDIACFFIGIDKRIVAYLWKDLHYRLDSGFERMMELSLMKVDDNNELRMHDHLRDLGRAIACPVDKKLWDCSRLWDEEAITVQRSKEENRNIEALILDENGSSMFMKRSSFKRMPYLKFLRLSDIDFVGDFEDSLSELRWLVWEKCPGSFTATNVHLEKLLILDLSGGFISEIWEGWSSIKMEKLKFLNLSRCSKLKSTPNLSGFKSLEMLILENCKNLEKIDPSIGDVKCLVSLNLRGCVSLNRWSSIAMEKLKVLNLSGCSNLKSTPDTSRFKSLEMIILENCANLEEIDDSIGDVKCLVSLNLRDCRKLQKLPDPQLGELKNLEELFLDRTGIKKFPECIEYLKKLKMLSAIGCGQLALVPPQLGEVKGLVSLNLRACEKLKKLPEEMCELEELKELIICMTAIKELPPRIGYLKKLEMLDASDCKSLEGLPDSIGRLVNLSALDLKCCYSLKLLPESIGSLVKLQRLLLHNTLRHPNGNGDAPVENPIPDSIGCLEWLAELDLSWTKISELPESIGDLKNLKILKIERCVNLTTLPSTICKLGKLEVLDASNCERLGGEVPIDGMSSLRILQLRGTPVSGFPDPIDKLFHLGKLDLLGCGMIRSLPQSIGKLRSLQHLDLTYCGAFRLLPELPSSLTVLKVTCQHRTLPRLSHLIHLKELTVERCRSLESMPELPSGLLKLRVSSCGKLEELPSLSSLGSLSALRLDHCSELTKIEGLEALKSLEELDVSGCPKLSDLDGLERLESLRRITIDFSESDAPLWNDDLSLVRLKNLEVLIIRGCRSLRSLDLMQSTTHLKHLSTSGCSNLVEIKGLSSLRNLESWYRHGCTSLAIPDRSCFPKIKRW